jgi:hypothetical protein
MAGNNMPIALANLIWDILVADAGAMEQERNSFIQAQTRDEYRCTEFRFCGDLGFGGKFWVNNDRIYVSCYPEDMTKKRGDIIEKVNAKLAALKQE